MIPALDRSQRDSALQAEGDRVAQLWFDRIAAKIEPAPELLGIPLANIARWLARGHSARERLEGWRRMIAAARLLTLRSLCQSTGRWEQFWSKVQVPGW